MKRSDFLKSMALLPLAASVMTLKDLHRLTDPLQDAERMPALFIGHGSPTNGLDDNEFVRGWQAVAGKMPRPRAILCVSAHWETRGTQVTAMANPPTIHDFGGFQQELFDMMYPAPGSEAVAKEVQSAVSSTPVALDHQWGLDHGTWVPLARMYPDADIPVLQLSLDYTQGPEYHYALAQELASLRRKGILVVGSGNMVHNLGMARFRSIADLNTEFGFDWALEMNAIFKDKISLRDHKALVQYNSLHTAAKLAIPTPEHYLPLLYILGMQGKDEEAAFFNDKALAGSLTMTSVLVS